jgi:hypothetical protein
MLQQHFPQITPICLVFVLENITIVLGSVNNTKKHFNAVEGL